MDYKITGYEPAQLFHFFEEVSAIPRGSGNEKGISDFLVAFAKERGLDVYQDEVYNVIIRKPASAGAENAPTVMLQGHIDMVCDKLGSVEHDFTTDGIDLVVKDGVLTANGTTLGADNGIAVALMLAVLDDDSIIHPALECVFTTDEETGLVGAETLDKSQISARTMINLDSEEEGVATVSCAGGVVVTYTCPIVREHKTGSTLTLDISGLLGGHSGSDIHLERGNGNLIMARIIDRLMVAGEPAIVSFNGGTKDNAINRECKAVLVYVDHAAAEAAAQIARGIIADVTAELEAVSYTHLVPFDTPLFHWYDEGDRNRQLKAWCKETFDIDADLVAKATEQADRAQETFENQLQLRGRQVLENVREDGGYAVVIASRPYHNDPLVNHGLPKLFSERGIPVLTPDAVPGVCNVDLSNSRIDIVNNYHARMLSCAVIVASTPELELVQMGSFGCGHDAYLTDEIARMMGEMGSKVPMMIKLDESDVAGPMGIRVRSFIESVNRRRAEERAEGARVHAVHPLDDPYKVKYTKRDRHDKIALVPNTSHAFCRLMTAAMRNQGVRAEALDIGREDAIRLGKRYVHNDICFPAQIVIGEALAALKSGKYDPHDVAVVTGKYIGDCRLTHYMPLLRRALDDAGYDYVPVLTNDDVDAHNAHPGFKLGLGPSIQIAYGLPMIDALEAMLRRIRPYELEKGAADAAFDRALDEVIEGMERSGLRGQATGFKRALAIMDAVPYDRSNPHPTVLIVGEYLLNFHLGANHEIERYLEDNGLEVIEARMTDVIRKTYFYKHAQSREFHVDLSLPEKAWYATADNLFELAHDRCDRLGAASPLYEPPTRMPELVRASDKILHHTFDAGEGVLIPAEILEHAKRGCRNFVILQPFGCLPNHVVGRGLIHALKEQYPTAQFLPLDYDPDVSFANVENRLQMLIMNAKAQGCGEAHGETA